MLLFHCSNPLYGSVHGATTDGPYDTITLGNPSADRPDVSSYFTSNFGVGNIQEGSSVAEKEDAV